MKRILLLLLATVLVVFLSACGKRSELICDSCGVSFLGDADYSEQLKEDAELQEALGIDLYSFYCPDCRNEYAATALAVSFLTEEEYERLTAYRAGETVFSSSNIDDNITIVEPTGTEPYYVALDELSGLYGIYDISVGDWETNPIFSVINTYDSDGMALAQKDGYYGYINQIGGTVIGFQFKDAYPFNEKGCAVVRMNQVGVIDRVGTFIIEPMYQEITCCDNFIQVCDGRYYGLYNYEGDIVIAPEYKAEFLFIENYIYVLKNDRWYEVFDYDGNALLSSLRGVMAKDVALSSWVGENELVDGVSLPTHGIHVCHYSDSSTQFSYYRLFDSNLTLLKEQDYAYIAPFNELGYAAAVPCEFKATQFGYPTMDEKGDWIGINSDGMHFVDLPDIKGLYYGGDQYWGYKYLYINDYYGYAKWDGETLINISTGDVTRWKTIEPFDGTNYIIAQNDSTGLWTLFDGDIIVDSTCTEIAYDGDAFYLTHGGETNAYMPTN